VKFRSFSPHIPLLTFVVIFAAGTSAVAQDGTLRLHVNPKQAYLWVDDRAVSEASKHSRLELSAGEHKIELANYGYTPITRTVAVIAGKTTDLDVTLEKVGDKVSGPFGAIAIRGADRDAVLLNGKTPDFFVGHGDEFNTDFLWWKQELVVPPGTYEVTVQGGDKNIWSGQVSVAANQRVIVDIPKGTSRTEPWHRGEKLASVPRFAAGVASATVAVAQPSAEMSATDSQIYCGETSQLKWNSSDAPQVEINPTGTVSASGEQTVQPKQTTTYTLAATGPGGTTTSDVTINVDNAIDADLSLSPSEIHYKRVGDETMDESFFPILWRRDGYRLTNDDRRDSDFGDYFTLRFFALSGAPAGTLVFEATDPCKADDKKCTPQTAPRYYGLARATRRGAAMFNPECAKNDPLGKRPGVTVEEYGICDFTERAELEKALSALAATDWKASVTYRFMDSPK